jgi:hypothetical protein
MASPQLSRNSRLNFSLHIDLSQKAVFEPFCFHAKRAQVLNCRTVQPAKACKNVKLSSNRLPRALQQQPFSLVCSIPIPQL